MNRVGEQLAELAPALAFLLAAVPLAVLLDRLGYFEALAARITGTGRPAPVLALWVVAALTTVVLNLDTTVVLLTPLCVRIARRTDTDPIALALVPLLLASLASSVLPVSNLTNLIVTDHLHVDVAPFVAHLALPTFAACGVAWFIYRRRHPSWLPAAPRDSVDGRALVLGSVVVAGTLVGFVVGPAFGVQPWFTALLADIVLATITRTVPWREIPFGTALGVAAVAVAVALIVPENALSSLIRTSDPWAVAGITGLGAASADLVNNLPAVLVAANAVHRMTWGMWAWLLGVNAGAVLVPIGALASLLWLRIMRTEGVEVALRTYVRATFPIAAPAVVAAAGVLALERVLGW